MDYAEIKREIVDAGFFVQGPNPEELFARICPTAKYHPQYGYSGNSFWIAKVADRWFVGSWGGYLYTTGCPSTLGQFTVEWFRRCPRGTAADFDDWIVRKYGLTTIDFDEFDRLVGAP